MVKVIKKDKKRKRKGVTIIKLFHLTKEFLVNIFFDFVKGLFNIDIPELLVRDEVMKKHERLGNGFNHSLNQINKELEKEPQTAF